jgi:predicted Fe-Mo cluster-binding NifX family protein
MEICFPVGNNNGLESAVFGHFGSAPMFMVVNTETLEVTEVSTGSTPCPRFLQSPQGTGVDRWTPLSSSASAPALMGLNRAGLKVYRHRGHHR